MAARNFYHSIAIHTACRTTPLAGRKGIVARAAAEDVAVVAMAVATRIASTLRIISCCSMEIVIHMAVAFSIEGP